MIYSSTLNFHQKNPSFGLEDHPPPFMRIEGQVNVSEVDVSTLFLLDF